MGSIIINKLYNLLYKINFTTINLDYIEDNIQAKNSWLKNNFLGKDKSKLENFNVVLIYKNINLIFYKKNKTT